MADKIAKLLKKLSKKELDQLLPVIEKIAKVDLVGLDIKMLKGSSNIFRIRVGKLRIIFSLESGKTNILSISRRNERTYKDY